MSKFSLFLFHFIFYTQIFSQIVISNYEKTPIPFVQVTSNNKSFFFQSNVNGKIDKSVIKNLDDNDTLFFHHLSYHDNFKVKSDLALVDTIKMEEKSYMISEVSIVSKKENPKFQKINACYRSLQRQNDVVSYYTDGKVAYLTKNKRKPKYRLMRKEYRAFADLRIEDVDLERSIEIGVAPPTISRLPFEYLPSQYFSKYDLIINDIDSGVIGVFTRDNILIGKIESSPTFVKLILNDTFSIKTRHAFNTEVSITKQNVIMYFDNAKGIDILLIDDLNSLLYVQILREFKIKHKKAQDYTKVSELKELFIENVEFINSLNSDQYGRNLNIPQESKYQTNFWESCDCLLYKGPNKRILNSLNMRNRIN